MPTYLLKFSFIILFVISSLTIKGQPSFNADSIIEVINREQTIDNKLDLYVQTTRPFLVTLNRPRIEEFNTQLLRQINPAHKELFKVETDLLEAKLLAFMNKNDSAEIALRRILEPKNRKYMTTYSKTVEMLSLLYLNTGRPEIALKEINEFLTTSKDKLTNTQLAGLYYVRGITYGDMRFLNLSTRELLVADSLLPSGERGKIFYYQGLATNFGELEDLNSAEKYLIKAYQLSEDLNDEYTQNLTKIKLGILYQEQKKYSQCDSILYEAREYFQQNYNPLNLGNILDLLAKNNFLKREYLASIKGYKAKLKLKIIENDSIRLSNTYRDITENYVALKDAGRANVYLDSALLFFIAKKESIDYLQLLKTKGALKRLEGNYKEALFLKDELELLEKERLKRSNVIKTNELRYFYETEKKEKENFRLKTEKAEIEKEKQSQFYQFLIGIIILIMGLAVVYLLFKNRQKRNEKLKELDTLKSKFFESISHELRTPLTLIQLPVSKALEKREPVPEKELNTIKYNTKRLQNLMDDLLSITRIESNKYPISITENNVTKQTQIQSAQFDSLAESNGIEYIKKIDNQSILAKYDKEVYTKILVNLVSNAIKYSDRGGKVTVDFEVKNDKAFLTVSDEGKGIRKEEQQYIFDKFYRVDQHNENVPGSGIGLSIVKELLEIIGGSISFESEENKGTRFFVEFPLGTVEILKKGFESTMLKRQKWVNSGDSEGKEIEYDIDHAEKPILLLVEDNEELLNYMQKDFSEDFKVIVANNGKLGIEKGVEMVPDLIISDWLMPEKNGIELCEAIKQNEITSHIPVVMLTAKTEIEDKIKGFETGADAYVAKPFEMSVLNAQVQSMIHQRKKILEKFKSGDIQISTQEFSKRDLEFWNKVKTSVDNNLSNPDFSVQALAEELFVSRMQLNRKLKALISISGSEYIINTKMKLAKNLLKNKDLQISEIGYKIGYDNSRSFARAFKKETGKTPSEYRKD